MQAPPDSLDASVPEPTDPSPAPRPRRRHSARFKAELVRLAADPDRSVASVAREHHVNANQLFRWIADARRGARRGAPPEPGSGTTMVPVAVASLPAGSRAPTPPPSATAPPTSPAAATLEVEVPGATLRFGPGWTPGPVAALLELLRS